MSNVDQLMDDDLVCSSGEVESAAGRSRLLVKFDDSAYIVIGVDPGEEELFGAVSELSGNSRTESNQPV